MGASAFALPKYLRHVARAGLKDCWVIDLVNAHPQIQHARHPHLVHLKDYVEHRDEWLGKIPAGREEAKRLMIRLIYGGTIKARFDFQKRVSKPE
jgi:hypothetical protein